MMVSIHEYCRWWSRQAARSDPWGVMLASDLYEDCKAFFNNVPEAGKAFLECSEEAADMGELEQCLGEKHVAWVKL